MNTARHMRTYVSFIGENRIKFCNFQLDFEDALRSLKRFVDGVARGILDAFSHKIRFRNARRTTEGIFSTGGHSHIKIKQFIGRYGGIFVVNPCRLHFYWTLFTSIHLFPQVFLQPGKPEPSMVDRFLFRFYARIKIKKYSVPKHLNFDDLS